MPSSSPFWCRFMTKENLEKKQTRVLMATVYLKSKTGQSLIDERPITKVSPYLPTEKVRKKAKEELEKRGFRIEGEGVTLSVSGPVELFERTCNTTITQEEVPRGPGSPEKVTVYKSSQKVMKIKGLEDLIEGIVIAGKAVLF